MRTDDAGLIERLRSLEHEPVTPEVGQTYWVKSTISVNDDYYYKVISYSNKRGLWLAVKLLDPDEHADPLALYPLFFGEQGWCECVGGYKWVIVEVSDEEDEW